MHYTRLNTSAIEPGFFQHLYTCHTKGLICYSSLEQVRNTCIMMYGYKYESASLGIEPFGAYELVTSYIH